MKVCHVSTFDGGGAFIAAYRYHEQLLKTGIDSTFLVAPKSRHKNLPGVVYDKYNPSLKQKLLNRVNSIAKNRKTLQALKGEYEMFSFPETVFRAEENEHIQKADIVHLHFVSQYINYPTFFRKIQKPVVWTLHDMNPLMGGFHYNIDLERNKETFHALETTVALRKNRLTTNGHIHFVALSNWMAGELQQSHYANSSVSVVNNGIDLSLYKPCGQPGASSLPRKKKILFVAESLKNYRKGFDLLLEAVNDKEVLNNAELAAMGSLDKSTIPPALEVNCLGYISSEQEKIQAYNNADVIIIPSREDNFPNIMPEAMACGKPVIAFANGGMADVVDNTTNGILVRDINATALREAILKFLNSEVVFDAKIIRQYAEEKLCIQKQTSILINLYESLL